jgi:hypothetical protein
MLKENVLPIFYGELGHTNVCKMLYIFNLGFLSCSLCANKIKEAEKFIFGGRCETFSVSTTSYSCIIHIVKTLDT